MGIRFYCPNGHKLNVKEFQAGQTGICPECGAKMQIPLQSTRPSSRHQKEEQESEISTAKADAPVVHLENPQPAGASLPAKPVPLPPPPPPPPRKIPDPKEDAANLAWYVRPSAGGQFGPANTELIHQWLGEGRIDPNALVWREGWHDWLQADCVFPELSLKQIMPDLETIGAERGEEPTPVLPPKHQVKPRKPTPLIILGVLTTIVIVLLVILAVIIARQ